MCQNSYIIYQSQFFYFLNTKTKNSVQILYYFELSQGLYIFNQTNLVYTTQPSKYLIQPPNPTKKIWFDVAIFFLKYLFLKFNSHFFYQTYLILCSQPTLLFVFSSSDQFLIMAHWLFCNNDLLNSQQPIGFFNTAKRMSICFSF